MQEKINDRKAKITALKGRAADLEAKLEGLSLTLNVAQRSEICAERIQPGLYMAKVGRDSTRANEISVKKFQMVRVIMVFSDGWGHCINQETGEEGILPLSILKSINTFEQSNLQLAADQNAHQIENDESDVNEPKLSLSKEVLSKEPGTYVALQDRNAESANEISLRKDQIINVFMVFSDGWALCLNETTGDQGMVPLEILEVKMDLGKVSSDFAKISKKHSVEFKELGKNLSNERIGYYRVLDDRLPVQASEIIMVKDNVVYVSSIFSDGWCQCMNIETMESGDCPVNMLEWIEDQNIFKNGYRNEAETSQVKNQGLYNHGVKSQEINANLGIDVEDQGKTHLLVASQEKILEEKELIMIKEEIMHLTSHEISTNIVEYKENIKNTVISQEIYDNTNLEIFEEKDELVHDTKGQEMENPEIKIVGDDHVQVTKLINDSTIVYYQEGSNIMIQDAENISFVDKTHVEQLDMEILIDNQENSNAQVISHEIRTASLEYAEIVSNNVIPYENFNQTNQENMEIQEMIYQEIKEVGVDIIGDREDEEIQKEEIKEVNMKDQDVENQDNIVDNQEGYNIRLEDDDNIPVQDQNLGKDLDVIVLKDEKDQEGINGHVKSHEISTAGMKYTEIISKSVIVQELFDNDGSIAGLKNSSDEELAKIQDFVKKADDQEIRKNLEVYHNDRAETGQHKDNQEIANKTETQETDFTVGFEEINHDHIKRQGDKSTEDLLSTTMNWHLFENTQLINSEKYSQELPKDNLEAQVNVLEAEEEKLRTEKDFSKFHHFSEISNRSSDSTLFTDSTEIPQNLGNDDLISKKDTAADVTLVYNVLKPLSDNRIVSDEGPHYRETSQFENGYEEFSEIALSKTCSYEQTITEKSFFESLDGMKLENGLKVYEIKSQTSSFTYPILEKPNMPRSMLTKLRNKLPRDDQELINVLKLIRMISIFLLSLQFFGYACFSLVNTMMIAKRQLELLMPSSLNATDLKRWITYIFFDVFEVDRFPVFLGNTLATIASTVTIWEAVLVGFNSNNKLGTY